MTKRCFITLALAAVVAGGAFAQTNFQTMPKNTITVDLGPTILGGALSMGSYMLGYEGYSDFFGIAAQYERQLHEELSVGARFAYGGFSMELRDEENEEKVIGEGGLSSFSLEAHVRYYPFAKTFFLDGMLGYANLSMKTNNYKDSDQQQITYDYFKYGAKLGWRIDFGRPGGFTFEPAIGYYAGIRSIGKGDSINDTIGGDEDEDDYDSGWGSVLEKFVLVGGPRITLAVGWRF